ncbi:MAG: AAA family ATPase [Eggerthellaceae bacterium]|jgi:5-methylcytosine-specific restriction protein B
MNNDIDISALEHIVSEYKKHAAEIRPGELYKWEGVACFQQHWNPKASDFTEMLESALSQSYNLLSGGRYFPKGMLVELAQFDTESVRAALAELLDGTDPLRKRMEAFSNAMEDVNRRRNSALEAQGQSPAKNTYQDPHAMSVYLAFAHPEIYYLYKASIYWNFAKMVSISTPTDKYDRAIAFFQLLDSLTDWLTSTHPEVLELSDSLLDNGLRAADPKYHILMQDIVFYAGYYMKKDKEKQVQEESPEEGHHVWMYAPGENAAAWKEFADKGIMGLGWDQLGDLANYQSQDEIAQKLRAIEGTDSSKKNDSLACWQFQNEMNVGDIVYAKNGSHEIVGRGIVTSGAKYDSTRNKFTHIREVNWDKIGHWDAGSISFPTKTLTDWTEFASEVTKLETLLGNNVSVSTKEASDTGANSNPVLPTTQHPQHWFLVANPKIWSFSDIQIGEEQSYTIYNENGNPRRMHKNFLDAKPGDIVIGYEATPVKKIIALCEVSREHDNERVYFRKTRDVANPVPYSELKDDESLAQMEYMRNRNGSFFKLTDDEFDEIESLIDDEEAPIAVTSQSIESYTDEDFLADVYLERDELNKLKTLLRRKKNIILQGAPGTGKTFAAKRLAWCMMGKKNASCIQTVQFHQSTTYDDFVYGYRPDDNGGFTAVPGTFVEFCRRATVNPAQDYFFIIDEINRANISKVLGELLMLIEADHRGDRLTLPISGESFSVPDNVYLIGMMNTADRGLALIDYALRRRFAFYEMQPALDNQRFIERIRALGDPLPALARAVEKLNRDIEDDSALGRGFRIGHSYFCLDAGTDPVAAAESIVEFELVPLIEEYWFDDPDKATKETSLIEDALK